jgi:hypothetical protein
LLGRLAKVAVSNSVTKLVVPSVLTVLAKEILKMNTRRLFTICTLAFMLAGCGVVETMVNAVEYQKATETDLQALLGVKPGVGFNMQNTTLSVTVVFPDIRNPPKPLAELADVVREIVTKDFKRPPDSLVVGFAVGK